MSIFGFEGTEVKKLEKFYKGAPGLFNRAARGLLNGFAFGTRNEAIDTIKHRMIVRNEKFVKSRIRVNKTKGSRLDNMFSETGSLPDASGNFQGWVEQEEGKTAKRTRVQTLVARGNNLKNKVRPKYRMKNARNFINENTWDLGDLRDESKRVGIFIKEVIKRNYREPFILTKRYRKMKRGVYIYRSKRILRLQNFESENTQPKRIKWMTIARNNYFRSIDIRKEWAKSINIVLPKKL